MKVYKQTFGPLDAWDAVFGDLLNKTITPGDRVRVWDHTIGRYVVGTANFWAGQPSVKLDPSPALDRAYTALDRVS